MKSNKVFIEIQFGTAKLEESINAIMSVAQLKKILRMTIQNDAQLTLRFTGKAESRKLNAAYRNKDYATNILTFNYHTPGQALHSDLVICWPILVQEAKTQGKSIVDHLSHLLVHGALHAQGFDHEDEIEAEAMESLEVAILQKLKIANPYL
jgi:probable rRNA maturation factor